MDKWYRWHLTPKPPPRPPEEIWWTREWYAAQFRAGVELCGFWVLIALPGLALLSIAKLATWAGKEVARRLSRRQQHPDVD